MRPSLFWRLWLWPLLIGLISAVGLLTALLGDGAWDWLSIGALGLVAGTGIKLSLGWRLR